MSGNTRKNQVTRLVTLRHQSKMSGTLEFGPNIFRQYRALNRGWSDKGRRFRALEREAAAGRGTFYFGHLLNQDDTAYPMVIEIGILRDGNLHVEGFQNRFPPGPTA